MHNITYTNARGEVIVLDDSDWNGKWLWAIFNRDGFEAPRVKTEETTFADGSIEISSIMLEPRDVTLYFVVRTGTAALRDKLEALKRSLIQIGLKDRTWGQLMVRNEDGAALFLDCVYTGGLDDFTRQYRMINKFSLTFRAEDPLFYEQSTTELSLKTYSEGDRLVFRNTTHFGSGTHFRSSNATHQETVALECFRVYPEIVITGPAANIMLQNVSAGKTIRFDSDFELLMGESVEIHTRPNDHSVWWTKQNGTKVKGKRYLTADTSLDWYMESGENLLRFRNSVINEASVCRLSYNKGYLSAN